MAASPAPPATSCAPIVADDTVTFEGALLLTFSSPSVANGSLGLAQRFVASLVAMNV